MNEDLRKKLAERTARIRKEIAEASTDIKTAVGEKGEGVDEQVRVLLDKFERLRQEQMDIEDLLFGKAP